MGHRSLFDPNGYVEELAGNTKSIQFGVWALGRGLDDMGSIDSMVKKWSDLLIIQMIKYSDHFINDFRKLCPSERSRV